jgi:hypothetical protein
MAGLVGSAPGRYYAGVVVVVAAPQVSVQISDQPDANGDAVTLWATGTAAVNDKVTVLIQPTGRAVIVKG